MLPKVVAGIGTHGVCPNPNNGPNAGNDEADGEDHDLDARKNKGTRAIPHARHLVLDRKFGETEGTHDDLLRENTRDKGRLVRGNVGADLAALRVYATEG